MHKFYSMLLSLACWHSVHAQAQFPDTLLVEPVVGDPISAMATAPSGNDNIWVNFDQDLITGICVSSGDTPIGWYIEGDFGLTDPNALNDAFTSCSYLTNEHAPNDNWLILPPVLIPDSTYSLCWRSLPLEAPAYMDGYEVRASTASNEPASGDFAHLLFTAAEMLAFKMPGNFSLDPDDYILSPGYVHANNFTDTNYYYKVLPNGPLRGRMEPHCVPLAAFAGKTIYLAFHHNSMNDNQLQVDDIVISKKSTVAAKPEPDAIVFDILPNPAKDRAFVSWTMKQPQGGRLLLHDFSGRLVLQQSFAAYGNGSHFLDLSTLPAGLYACTLQTESASSTKKLLKL